MERFYGPLDKKSVPDADPDTPKDLCEKMQSSQEEKPAGRRRFAHDGRKAGRLLDYST